MRTGDGSSRYPFFFSWEVSARGLTRRQLQSKRFQRFGRDLYASADLTMDLRSRCHAMSLLTPPDAAFSHYTAAQLYRAPVPEESLLHISTHRNIEPRIQGLVAHRVRALGEIWTVDELRVLSPARTFVDLASRLDMPGLLAAGDVLSARSPGGVSDLEAAVRDAGQRRGVRLARETLPHLDPAAESAGESRLRLLLVLAGLPRPLSQFRVMDDEGNEIARVDLAYPRLLVAVEYEGTQHLTDRKQWNRDIHRHEELIRRGWIVIRVTAEDLFQRPEQVIARIRAATVKAGR